MWSRIKNATAGFVAITSAVVSGAATIASGVITATAVASVVAVGSAAVAVVAAGFAAVDYCKEQKTKRTYLKSGWVKIDYLEETQTGPRVIGGIFSLGMTEIFGTHYRIYKSEIIDTAGNLLGSTISEAIAKVRKLGEEFYGDGKYQEARDCFTEAMSNCADEMGNDQKVFLKNINNASAEIHYKEGLDFVENGEHSAAIDSFKAANLLCSIASRKFVFVRALNNAIADEFYQKGQKIINEENENEYPRAKEYFNQAVQKCSRDYSEREKFKQSRESASAMIEKINNKKKAAELFKDGQSLFEKACSEEIENNAEEAARNFDEANEKLKEAVNVVSDNAQYRKWAGLCKTKIEGNDLYNRMSSLTDEGNILFEKKQYRDARTKYKMACELILKAEEKFTEIDQALGNATSEDWLAHVKQMKESLLETLEKASRHVPSQKLHERQNQANREDNRAAHLYTTING